MVESAELLKKLQIKAETRLWLVNAPPDIAQALRAGAGIETVEAGDAYDGVVAFCENPPEVESFSRSALAGLPDDGLLWFAYRKGATGKAAGLSRDVGWDALLQQGYCPVRAVAIDENWTGMRFRPLDKIKNRNDGPSSRAWTEKIETARKPAR
jgi:hypothetical protein